MTKRGLEGYLSAILGIAWGAFSLEAQPTLTLCIAPPTAQSFSIERAVMAADTDTTYPTVLSSQILSSLAAGIMETREQLVYNPQANTLTSTVFLVAAGTSLPTPASVNIAASTLAVYTISINQVLSSCSPAPSLMFVGTVTSSAGGADAPNGIYGLTFSGTPAVVSIGYTLTNPPVINNVVTLFAGVAASFSPAGFGTLTFPASGVAGQPNIASVANAAGLLPSISPNTWVTITGSGLASQTDTWNNSIVNGALPTSLDGVKVTIGGQPAYVEYISSGQINVVAPQATSGSLPVVVTNSLGTSSAFTVSFGQYSPAFFVWPGSQAVATHLNGTYAVKAGTFAGLSTTPAQPGETITLWGTGFGATSPATPIGMVVPTSPIYDTATLPSVTLNSSPITVLGAALSPGSAALYQVNVQIPSGLSNGDYSIQTSIGGVTSPLGIILTVQQ